MTVQSRLNRKLDKIGCELSLLRHLVKLDPKSANRKQLGLSTKELKKRIYDLQILQTDLKSGRAKLYYTRTLTRYTEQYGDRAYRHTPFYYVVQRDTICGNKFYLWKDNALRELKSINEGKPCVGSELPRQSDWTVDENVIKLKLPSSHLPARVAKPVELMPPPEDDDIANAYAEEAERELKRSKRNR